MPKLILASRSPRRAQLLADAGYVFEQATPPFDDTGHEQPGLSPEALAIELASRKAASFAGRQQKGSVVLCADTLCVSPEGQPIGKPRGRAEALAMIQGFMNDDHDIITGVALLDEHGSQTAFADAATASFGELAEAELRAYLETDQWADKAGGYNLFDRQAAGWPITVVGDPTTVVGLPMRRLNQVLPTLGIHPQHA